jgi:hypothetical protein
MHNQEWTTQRDIGNIGYMTQDEKKNKKQKTKHRKLKRGETRILQKR